VSYWLDRPFYTLGMLYLLAMVIWAVLSWFPLEPGSFASKAQSRLYVVIGPFVSLFRKFVPPIGSLDASFLVAFLVVYVLSAYVLSLIVV